MKNYLPAFFVVWLLVLAQVSYAQSVSLTSNPPESDAPSAPVGAADGDVGIQADDTCNTAVDVSLGTWDTFNVINPSGDVDWYRWYLPGDGRFTVDVDVPSSRDYDVIVYRNCAGSVACSSAKDKGLDEQCSADVASAGYIYAKVYGYNGDSSWLDAYSIRGTLSRSYDLTPVLGVSPSSPFSQDDIYIQFGHANQGPNTITNTFNSKLYIDGAHKSTCNQNVNLPKGWMGTCLYPTKLSKGTHVIKVDADADNNIGETNEGNNRASTNFAVKGTYDIIVTDIYTDPAMSLTDKAVFDLVYSVKNAGTDDYSGSFTNKMFIDGALAFSCTHLSGIKAGETQACALHNKKFSAGTHTVKVIADTESQVAETNEGNNERSEDFPVAHLPEYDLVPMDFAVTPGSPSDIDSIKVRYTVKNNGPDDITSKFDIKLYIDNILYGTCNFDSGLKVSDGVWGCDRPGIKLSVGTHVLKNVVDEANNIPETDNGNNVKTQNLPVISGCVDKDGDGYGNPAAPSCPKGGAIDCNDNDAAINPGESENCSDGKDNDCDGSTDGGDTDCCDPPGYFCAKTASCWDKKSQCDQAILCNNAWYACTVPEGNVIKCVDNKAGCCKAELPYFCPDNNFCFAKNGFCDGRPVYNCNGKFNVCNSKTDVGQCFGNVLKCCPPDVPYWWESDSQCHASPFSPPPPCPVKDGTSAFCDCNTNSDCPPEKPYCEENYPSPFSDGYDACILTPPEFCGNGKCTGGEDFKSCFVDCEGAAPKGKITITVAHSQAKLPIKYATIIVDGIPSGGTDQFGKAVLEVPYGVRRVRVECFSGSFCGERASDVKGWEFMSFSCECSNGDLDGDEFSDADEVLIGTDPYDVKSYPEGLVYNPVKCVTDAINILLVWLKDGSKDDLLQAHSSVVETLSLPYVSGVATSKQPVVVLEALQQNHPAANLDVRSEITIREAVERAEYIDAVLTQDELLYIISDNETQTTAIVEMKASCVGTIVGTAYGIGKGVEDDLGLLELPVIAVNGLISVVANLDEFSKIHDGFLEMVDGFMEAVKNFDFDMTRYNLIKFIFEEGRKTNPYREDKRNDRPAYYHYQLGFFSGYVTGYIVEQVVFLKVAFTVVKNAFKVSGKLLARLSKGGEILEQLAAVTKHPGLGIEIAKKVNNLPYVKGAVHLWTNDELIRLGKLTKYNEKWARSLTKAEAENALKLTKNIPDSNLEKLVSSKLGRQTLKAADATDGLLAKQSKLVQKWGVKKADDVVSKCFLFWCDAERINDLNKLLKELSDEAVDVLKPQNAAGIISDKSLSTITEALSELKSVTNYGEVANNLAKQSTWTGFSNQLKQALKLKKAGKTIVEFEKPIPGTLVDIVYRNAGSVTEIFMETKNTISSSFDAINDLKKQLSKYYDHTQNWDAIRLTSENPIPQSVIKELENEFGSEAVKKILSG